MGSPDVPSGVRGLSKPTELQRLVPKGSRLGKVSTRPFEDFDGSTKQINVLHVGGAKAIIAVLPVGDKWRAETIFGELRNPTEKNQHDFSVTARDLGAINSTRPAYSNGELGEVLEEMALVARRAAPGENQRIISRRRILVTR